MITTVALVLLFASPSEDQTTLPRRPETSTQAERARDPSGTPTDPYFDAPFVATDDAAFILGVVETSRQGIVDARTAGGDLKSGPLRETAQDIAKQNETTTRKLESLAKKKGWRLPESNAGRATTLSLDGGAHRIHANFIVNQIAFHQTILAQMRAQLGGTKDADLKRTLKEAVPGYEKNLMTLLTAKP